ncbi:hypothetical protein GKG47_09115 [Lactonifactor sp. BIOML-A3]|uniref:hypothetical protein n=1 Tax=unclassified Lactonifactor TaxID=2636670 RepID=UPI0012AFF5BF|nr:MULTISPECIES: hypothetical protein [unclassified Lactonifactor]MSA02198.1 hypothetical protein [Lactonifactor sp. BIOML-A5]MSA07983.1 hypothetical protein [Lactonifactor sp. BIOML-A4]MSA12599.1 hypothetical protein [Lactonifactor sp. BIOML-A3]MSA16700.1 hypothetical protein [Lactonifactor sp. BIOML-A2]MSA37601.1 hypothetical protein [Lactonifactor sp. BIOML-A1]
MNNVVFDPELYIAQGGKIIDFDPAYAAREKARRRAIEKRKRIQMKEILEEREYFRQQRKMGLFLSMAALFCFLFGNGAILVLGVMLFLIGAGMIATKKMVLVNEYWERNNL